MRATTRQFAAFAAIGALGFVVDGGLMTALSQFGALSPMQARPFSFAVAVTVTWQLNRSLVFGQAAKGSVGEWARYAGVNGLGALVNLAVFYAVMLAVPPLQAAPLIALALAAGAALVCNFAGTRRLVFAGPGAPTRTGDARSSATGSGSHGH